MIALAPRSRDEMSYDQAILYCTFCNHNGHKDWRMPRYKEYLEHNGIIGWYLNRDEDEYNTWCVIPVRDI